MYNPTEAAQFPKEFSERNCWILWRVTFPIQPLRVQPWGRQSSAVVPAPLAAQHTHLRSEHEGLHEPAHGLHVIGELPHHLHHHAVVEGGVGVHVTDLCVAILEV